MFRLDNNFLIELGLGSLPAEEKNKMLAHIYETLEMRVGMKLAEQMSDEQLKEFEAFIDRNDEAGVLTWLETNFPNYKQVVADELERLKGEIKQVAPQLLATAAQHQAAAPTNPPQPVAPPPAPAPAQPHPGYQQPAPQPPYQQPVQPYEPPVTPQQTPWSEPSQNDQAA